MRSSRIRATTTTTTYVVASVIIAVISTLAAVGTAPSAVADDRSAGTNGRLVAPVDNLLRQGQRARIYSTPAYQARLRAESTRAFARATATLRRDPERNFVTDVCWSKALVLSACLGDTRLYDWTRKGYGRVEPVLFTNRSGATISGHVWATRSGPARRPAVVITSGSLQATEQMYWWAAQTLAKAGYVVLTTDAQNQGMSNTFGEGVDRLEGALSQATGNTFFDGTQDALDFMLSTPKESYCPRASRSGHRHCAKQVRRTRAGLDTGHNPFWRLVDPTRVGLVGHSAGALGVSYVGQLDKRVDAVVALDNLCVPAQCLLRPPGPAPRPRVPSLGISQDYTAGPVLSPLNLGGASKKFSAAGIDSGQLYIRGGTHFEYSFLPQVAFPATLRGMDLSAWYTTAWFDKYLRGDPTADRRLLTRRWRTDGADRTVDPAGRGNLYSTTYRSRLDITRDAGRRFRCENLRAGCSAQPADDRRPAHYSFLRAVTRPDG